MKSSTMSKPALAGDRFYEPSRAIAHFVGSIIFFGHITWGLRPRLYAGRLLRRLHTILLSRSGWSYLRSILLISRKYPPATAGGTDSSALKDASSAPFLSLNIEILEPEVSTANLTKSPEQVND